MRQSVLNGFWFLVATGKGERDYKAYLITAVNAEAAEDKFKNIHPGKGYTRYPAIRCSHCNKWVLPAAALGLTVTYENTAPCNEEEHEPRHAILEQTPLS